MSRKVLSSNFQQIKKISIPALVKRLIKFKTRKEMRNLHMVAGYSERIMSWLRGRIFDWKSGKGVRAARNYYLSRSR
jgi:hypothetical protein